MSSQSEAQARTRIEAHLRKLGWVLDGDEQNVYQEGDCATVEQKRKLKGSRPDYILYRKGTNEPLAVIEAKRPGGAQTLDSAIRQAAGYAAKIGAELVFASDSYVTTARRVNGEPIRMGRIRVENFVREPLMARLALGPAPDMQIVQSRDDMIKVFEKAERELRRDGIDAGMEAVYEFCIILFIKIHSETSGDGVWEELCAQGKPGIIRAFRKVVRRYKEAYPGIFREMKISKADVLLNIIGLLKGINLVDTDLDIKGEAYEHFIKRYSSWNKSVLGQYFTPRHITDMMAVYLDPVVGEKIYDPFCGTGGMLISCYRAMFNYLESDRDVRVLKKHTLYGHDLSNGASQLTQMNMIVIGDGHTNIKRMDSLENKVHRKFDKVITNIPFNLDGDFSAISRTYRVREANPNILCILHCLRAAKVGGNALIIVPENICYDDGYKSGRELLLKEARLNAAIRLPRATFKAYTAARACILHFADIGMNKKTVNFAYVDIKHDGFSDSTWREPINENGIPDFLENRANLKKAYGSIRLNQMKMFVPPEADADFTRNYWLLRDIAAEKPVVALDPAKEYKEPGLNSDTNTIAPRGKPRLGANFKGSKKRLIEPGDLVIATLHTQRGNGLFAISDDYYVGESQLVLKIKEDMVAPEYLKAALRRILPTLKVDDLVGRETFKREDLLNLRIPKQPGWFASEGYKRQVRQLREMEKSIQETAAKYIQAAFDKAK